MADEISSIKSLASLRHLFPTLWYVAADGSRLIEPLKDQTFSGLTRPWSFLGATSLLSAWAFTKAHAMDPGLSSGNFATFGWKMKFDLWLCLVIPFILFSHFACAKAARSAPSLRATASLWLYLFGALVFGQTAQYAAVLLTGQPYQGLAFPIKALANIFGGYFMLFRPYMLLMQFYRIESEEDISGIELAVANSATRAFILFVVLSVLFYKADWQPHHLLLPFERLLSKDGSGAA